MGINEYIKVGERIKQLRMEKGIKQKDMAEKLGVRISTYSNYENGHREPELDILKNISSILSVSLDDLLGLDGGDKISNKEMGIGNNMRAHRKMRGLTAHDVADLLKIPYSTYCDYEKGLKDPSYKVICLYSMALNVPLEDLLVYHYAEDVNYDYGDCQDTSNQRKIMTDAPDTIAAHFDGEEFTEEQLEKIKAFAAFIKSEDRETD